MKLTIFYYILFSLLACQLIGTRASNSPDTAAPKRFPIKRDIFRVLDKAKREQEKKIIRLKRLQDILYKHVFNDSETNERYLSSYMVHPVSAFVITNLFSHTLDDMKFDEEQDEDSTALEESNYDPPNSSSTSFPSMTDYIDFGKALLRIQAFYDIPIDLVVSGKLPQLNYKLDSYAHGLEMRAFDCFGLGKIAYGNGDWSTSKIWFNKALEMLAIDEFLDVDRSELFEYMAFAAYREGKVKSAAEWTRSWLAEDPTNERALSNLEYYLEELEVSSSYDSTELEVEDKPKSHVDLYGSGKKILADDYVLTDDQVVRRLCRNDLAERPSNRYTCKRKRILDITFVQPEIRIETLNSNPKIIRIHDIVTEEEAQQLRQLAETKLERSTVNSKQGLVISDFRIAKTAWLSHQSDPIAKQLGERVSRILNLDLSDAESLQLVNYGVGGFYGPHLDSARGFINDEDNHANVSSLRYNDRLATVLIYLNKVESGGATVFPRLNLTAEAIERSAVVWFNLLDSGHSDPRTLHTGCPVLLGFKWIATFWPREGSNIFLKPCKLKRETNKTTVNAKQ